MFDNIKSDFRANGSRLGHQGFWALAVYRFGRWRYTVRPAALRKIFSAAYHVAFKLTQIVTGIELPCEVTIGKNFAIDHFGGIIVSGYASFGENCRIRPGVVVGLRRVEEPCAPRIGNNVDIGAGAKLLGPIRIGHNALIGANAVVLIDVPDDHTATGVPAICQPRRYKRRSVLAKLGAELHADDELVRGPLAGSPDRDRVFDSVSTPTKSTMPSSVSSLDARRLKRDPA